MANPTYDFTRGSAAEATNPLQLIRIDHLQLTGSIEKLELLYRRLGFARVASQKAPWGRQIHLRQERMDILIFEANEEHLAGQYFKKHGEGAWALNFQVASLDHALKEALKRGGRLVVPPETHHVGSGRIHFAAIQGVGDVLNYFIEREGACEPFWPGLSLDPLPALCTPGLVRIDHLTNNVGPGEMDELVKFYEDVFGFVVTRTFNIRGQLGTGLNSKVVQSSDNRIMIPINEPTDDKSQVQEYVNRHKGQGIQHIAMSTNDIFSTLRALKSQGFRFLEIPQTYYDLLPSRIAKGGYQVRESLATAEELRVQIDGDTTGYLLQIFTEDQIGPLFFEIIQRRGNMGFGEGNFQALYDSIELDQKKRGVL
jgi:4-hydroxyphenylpyruvate dioxygenase